MIYSFGTLPLVLHIVSPDSGALRFEDLWIVLGHYQTPTPLVGWTFMDFILLQKQFQNKNTVKKCVPNEFEHNMVLKDWG